ncbi:hypothetical protein TNCV_1031821 [Trichonephila clavipes]|nr:hypothetical protein TNCV_1031821 [Trichonephila clavipes]
MDPQPRNQAQLSTALESAWLNIPENTFRDLSDSLPARLAAVHSAKAGRRPGLRRTCPVSRNRFHSVLMTLLATPTVFATDFYVCPDSCLQRIRQAMDFDRFR